MQAVIETRMDRSTSPTMRMNASPRDDGAPGRLVLRGPRRCAVSDLSAGVMSDVGNPMHGVIEESVGSDGTLLSVYIGPGAE